MKQIKIIVDSNFNFTSNELKKNNLSLIPLKIIIDGKEIDDDTKKITFDELYQVQQEKSVATSQNSPFMVESIIKKSLSKYDKVYFLPISKEISGTYNTALTISNKKQFKDRFFVIDVDNAFLGARKILEIIQPMIEKDEPLSDVNKAIADFNENSAFYFMPTDLSYLQKGGRLGPLAGTIGTLLKIKILLKFTNKFHKLGKHRTFISGLNESFEDAKNNVIKGLSKNEIEVTMVHSSKDKENIEKFAEALKGEYGNNFKSIEKIAPIFMCHIGPETFGFYISKK